MYIYIYTQTFPTVNNTLLPLPFYPYPCTLTFTLLPCYPFTLLPFYPFTLLPFYPFTLLPFYPVTLLPFYPFTLLQKICKNI